MAILQFCKEHYGRQYAANSRETIRRGTLHQFIQAGLVVENPDNLDRPKNSPNWCYQIESTALDLCRTWGTAKWENTRTAYLTQQPSLQEKYARKRHMSQLPVTLSDGQEVVLSAGRNSELIQNIVTQFATRFVPGGHVLYLGDTGDKWKFFDQAAFADLSMDFDPHGKMPDVVLHHLDKNWLLLVEAVTSHGPMDGKRRMELAKLFQESTAGLVYVTAFPTRKELRTYLSGISWETEVWIADDPDHLIHFDGERFLGPYPLPLRGPNKSQADARHR